MSNTLEKISESKWNVENLEKDIKKFIADNNFGNGDILFPMRAALTGKSASPGPFEVANILGKQTTIKKVKKAITNIKNEKKSNTKKYILVYILS